MSSLSDVTTWAAVVELDVHGDPPTKTNRLVLVNAVDEEDARRVSGLPGERFAPASEVDKELLRGWQDAVAGELTVGELEQLARLVAAKVRQQARKRNARYTQPNRWMTVGLLVLLGKLRGMIEEAGFDE